MVYKKEQNKPNNEAWVADDDADLSDPWIAAHHVETILRYKRKGIPLSQYQKQILMDRGYLD